MTKYAITTRGRVPADDLGIVLPHEHLLFDLTGFVTEPLDDHERAVRAAGLSLDTSSDLRRSPLLTRENLFLCDEELSARELAYFRNVGGRTIVDCTLPEMKRDVQAADRIGAMADINVIVATGHYVHDMHGPEIAHQTVREVADWMVGEIRDGIEGTGIRAGVIKVGLTTVPRMPRDERKCLEAAAIAQAETGVPITIHNPLPFEKRGVEVIRILTRAGADPERVIMGHMTHTVPDSWYHRSIMDHGATIEFDRFGQELMHEAWAVANRWGLYPGEPRDTDVVNEIVELVKAGYVDHILLSHDIGFRNGLRAFGGFGYAHVPYRVTRYLRQQGLDDGDINQLIVTNPARLFAFAD
jgi:phosphotriesterase-related protein